MWSTIYLVALLLGMSHCGEPGLVLGGTVRKDERSKRKITRERKLDECRVYSDKLEKLVEQCDPNHNTCSCDDASARLAEKRAELKSLQRAHAALNEESALRRSGVQSLRQRLQIVDARRQDCERKSGGLRTEVQDLEELRSHEANEREVLSQQLRTTRQNIDHVSHKFQMAVTHYEEKMENQVDQAISCGTLLSERERLLGERNVELQQLLNKMGDALKSDAAARRIKLSTNNIALIVSVGLLLSSLCVHFNKKWAAAVSSVTVARRGLQSERRHMATLREESERLDLQLRAYEREIVVVRSAYESEAAKCVRAKREAMAIDSLQSESAALERQIEAFQAAAPSLFGLLMEMVSQHPPLPRPHIGRARRVAAEFGAADFENAAELLSAAAAEKCLASSEEADHILDGVDLSILVSLLGPRMESGSEYTSATSGDEVLQAPPEKPEKPAKKGRSRGKGKGAKK